MVSVYIKAPEGSMTYMHMHSLNQEINLSRAGSAPVSFFDTIGTRDMCFVSCTGFLQLNSLNVGQEALASRSATLIREQ